MCAHVESNKRQSIIVEYLVNVHAFQAQSLFIFNKTPIIIITKLSLGLFCFVTSRFQ